ncbi:peptidoglycan-recognition protein SC2-like [Branchiostoma floridae]|uniref:Peptidoglycan-recognition protein SC2-like n=1 Tax=Branchiostoma floridae TaxID=7739 RepID=A0A9J7LZJ6_BRAFL|nr:peptidoglycan-recognition protein SC2-like [Branchiostoma floridae]
MKLLFLFLVFVPACVLGQSACDQLSMVSRAGWGAVPPRATTPLSHPTQKVVIHHSDSYWTYLFNWGGYSDQNEYMDRVREIQQDHMDKNYDDIGYNFLIDGYGNVYVGRGWDNKGAHTACCNSIAIGINFIGYFVDDLPTSAALEAGKNLIACGVAMGKIRSGYDLNCHSDLGAANGDTECPGAALCGYAKGHFPGL